MNWDLWLPRTIKTQWKSYPKALLQKTMLFSYQEFFQTSRLNLYRYFFFAPFFYWSKKKIGKFTQKLLPALNVSVKGHNFIETRSRWKRNKIDVLGCKKNKIKIKIKKAIPMEKNGLGHQFIYQTGNFADFRAKLRKLFESSSSLIVAIVKKPHHKLNNDIYRFRHSPNYVKLGLEVNRFCFIIWFINWVDKCKMSIVKSFSNWCFEWFPFVRAITGKVYRLPEYLFGRVILLVGFFLIRNWWGGDKFMWLFLYSCKEELSLELSSWFDTKKKPFSESRGIIRETTRGPFLQIT